MYPVRLKTHVFLSKPKPAYDSNPDNGFISVFYAKQPMPLTHWERFDGPGNIRRTNEHSDTSIQILGSPSNQRTKLATPTRPYTTLGVKLPYMVIALKYLNRVCGFDVQILDNNNMRRRFQFTTRLATTRKKANTALIPLYLHQDWNEILLDLQDITKRLYGTDYAETIRIQIYPSCRIRMIYFSKIPLTIRKALVIMKVLLEEGKNVYDLKRLNPSASDASLVPALGTLVSPAKSESKENVATGSDNPTAPTVAELAPEQAKSRIPSAIDLPNEAGAPPEVDSSPKAISLTAFTKPGEKYAIEPIKLTTLKEYWNQMRVNGSFTITEEETNESVEVETEGEVQVDAVAVDKNENVGSGGSDQNQNEK